MAIVDQINKLTGGHATTIADAINYATKKKGDTIEEAVKNINFSGGGDDWGLLRQLNNGTLLNVVFPDDITETGTVSRPFTGYESLISVEMPNVVTIGDYAFETCTSLATVEMPNVVTIGEYAFESCESLTSVEMPNVTSIGDYAFSSCPSLASVVIDNTNPPIIGSDVFTNNHADFKIYVPASAVDTYKAAVGWSDYADKIVAIGS